MKISLFTTDASCKDIVSVKAAHITMFEKANVEIHFINNEEQLKFIEACIKHYVLIQIQGSKVTIMPESDNFQRVRFRFD